MRYDFIFFLFKKLNIIFLPWFIRSLSFNKSDHKFIGILFKKIIHIFINYSLTKVTFHFTHKDEKKYVIKAPCFKGFIIPPIGINIPKDNLINKNFLKDYLKIDKQSFLIGYIGRLIIRKILIH